MVTLSGGNQQKILFSRWARACHKVLILDEPTRGVDVGAKVEIYRIIRDLAEQGIGVIMISSELPEIIGMCDRVIVMREGVVTGELAGAEARKRRSWPRHGASGGPARGRGVSAAVQAIRRINPALPIVVGLLVALFAIGAAFSDRFGTPRNFTNVFEQAAGLGFVSLGQTLVILTGGIDLSIDGIVTVAAMLTSGLIDGDPAHGRAGRRGGLLIGALIGALNGALTVLLRVHPLIVTIGMASDAPGCGAALLAQPARHGAAGVRGLRLRPRCRGAARRRDHAGAVPRGRDLSPLHPPRPPDLRGRRRSVRGAPDRHPARQGDHRRLCRSPACSRR